MAALSMALSAGLAQLPSVQAEARLVALRVSLAHPTVVQAGAAFGLMGCEPPSDVVVTTVPSSGKETDALSFAATATSDDEQSLGIVVAVTTTRTEFVELAEGDQLILLEEGESPVVLASKLVAASTRIPDAVPGSEVPVYTASISRTTGIRHPYLAFRRNGVIVTKATLALFEIAPDGLALRAGDPVAFYIDGPYVDDNNHSDLTLSVSSADPSCASLSSATLTRKGRQVRTNAEIAGKGGDACTADLRVEGKGILVPFEDRAGQILTLDVVRTQKDLPVEARRVIGGASDAGAADAAVADAGAD